MLNLPTLRSESNRRRFKRYAIEKGLALTTMRNGVAMTLKGRCKNLGQGGVGVVMDQDLQLEETVSVELPLSIYADALRSWGTVRYRQGSEYGVEFHSLGTLEMATIQLVCEMLPQVG